MYSDCHVGILQVDNIYLSWLSEVYTGGQRRQRFLVHNLVHGRGSGPNLGQIGTRNLVMAGVRSSEARHY